MCQHIALRGLSAAAIGSVLFFVLSGGRPEALWVGIPAMVVVGVLTRLLGWLRPAPAPVPIPVRTGQARAEWRADDAPPRRAANGG